MPEEKHSWDTHAMYYKKTFINDHHTYIHNLSSCETRPDKIQAWKEFEPVTSAITEQCSTNWAGYVVNT